MLAPNAVAICLALNDPKSGSFIKKSAWAVGLAPGLAALNVFNALLMSAISALVSTAFCAISPRPRAPAPPPITPPVAAPLRTFCPVNAAPVAPAAAPPAAPLRIGAPAPTALLAAPPAYPLAPPTIAPLAISPKLPPLAAALALPVIAPAVTGSTPLAINITSSAIGATVLIMSPACDIKPGIKPPGDPGV